MATEACENVNSYSFSKSKHKGIALIFVNQNFSSGYKFRRGAQEDFRRLRETFTDLGFTVKPFFNVTSQQMLSHVKTISKMDHTDNASFVMAISSHGEKYEDDKDFKCKDSVIGTDAIPVPFTLLTSYFHEEKCPSLKNKPKLYFIQCCRGEGLSEEATVEDNTVEGEGNQEGGHQTEGNQEESVNQADGAGASTMPAPKRPRFLYGDDIPLQRHFLLACCVPPDYFAFHNMNGSWFLLELCNALQEFHNRMDLLRILSEVNLRVATKHETQIPSNPPFHQRRTLPWTASMLTKEVYI